MKRGFRMLMAALCSVVFLCGFSVTAYAGGGDEYMDYETEPVVETEPATEPEPAPTIEPGAGFAEEGNLVTRDLLYDKNTNKQFISVQTSGGNTFYIVIDYDKPTDEDGEQYQTYFLNMVDEADLLAAMQAAGGELPECACADKCAVGAINTDCTVCAVKDVYKRQFMGWASGRGRTPRSACWRPRDIRSGRPPTFTSLSFRPSKPTAKSRMKPVIRLLPSWAICPAWSCSHGRPLPVGMCGATRWSRRSRTLGQIVPNWR